MKEIYLTFKAEQKARVKTIRDHKSTRKITKGYLPEFHIIRSEFRYHHLALCLNKGRTLKQIERSNRENNKPDMDYVKKLREAYRIRVEEAKANEEAKEAVCVS